MGESEGEETACSGLTLMKEKRKNSLLFSGPDEITFCLLPFTPLLDSMYLCQCYFHYHYFCNFPITLLGNLPNDL